MSDIPSTLSKIQIEGAQFRAPVSENLEQAIGGAINGLLDFRLFQIGVNSAVQDQITRIIDRLIPVGTIFASMLDLSNFNAEIAQLVGGSQEWRLCDGSGISGSEYNSLSGQGSLPDLRGRFPRGKDHGAGQNPSGDLTLGTQQGDSFGTHDHDLNLTSNFNNNSYLYTDGVIANYGSGGSAVKRIAGSAMLNITASADVLPFGGTETRPKCVTVNYFIRVN